MLQVNQRGGEERKIPALTSYKSLESAGMIDITCNESIPWLQHQLKELADKYQVDAFYLDIGNFIS